jgi:transposase
MAKRYRVTLTAGERGELERMIARGKADARKLAHARVLLQADEAEGGPGWTDAAIAAAVRVSVRTIERVRQRFVEQGLAAALLPRPSPRLYGRKLDGEQEARLLALACARPPDGRARWSLRLPAERTVELEHVDALSHETVRQTLKKTSPSRTRGRCGASRRNSRRSSSTTWRMYSRSTAALSTRDTPSCAWTRPSRG